MRTCLCVSVVSVFLETVSQARSAAFSGLDLKVYCDPLCQFNNNFPDFFKAHSLRLSYVWVRYSYTEAGLVPGQIGLLLQCSLKSFIIPELKA